MLILRKMLAKKWMEDEISFLHRQLCMQIRGFNITENHSYTHSWEELYMASALENKRKKLAVLIIITAVSRFLSDNN